ncbi:hypothetical protein BDQ12DRAFT_50569 [Crucibulum laeve]|uniref:Rho GTPase activation protein n=1 Tax=Crucibulum laeve TaxID=68775 RepID=A0A5C3MIK5_9AGAR|nr:hypothetical protein BDQ12DRAFT_50569 [Crucibulum laeve]
MDISSPFHPPSTPSSPITSHGSGGLGDLRTISRRGWSKSADDLSKVSPSNFSPVKASFQEKIAEYRNRSDSAASVIPSPPLSPNLAGGHHPFPSLKHVGPPPSSPRSATLPPPVSISISAPSPEENDSLKASPTNTHVHVRSHSFTPKLPSKLSAPRFPPTPKRKGSGSSDREQESPKEAEKPVSPTRVGGYGFALGGPAGRSAPEHGGTPMLPAPVGSRNAPQPSSPTSHRTPVPPSTAQANRSTTIFATPIIMEPTSESHDAIDPKRSSQIVFHSGFINRLADVPNHFHHTNLTLAKGWKPYKLELKGSKLYFYKPPGDRNTALKELFPTGLVPPSQDEEEELSDLDTPSGLDEFDPGAGSGRTRKGKGREEGGGTLGRKKRAYWGRKTHPDLVRDMVGQIEKGTFEALLHETVFATAFPSGGQHEEKEAEIEMQEYLVPGERQEWKDFASSVLLSLPFIVGRSAFETELLRCCSYLVTGAEENAKAVNVARVGWLASEYLRYHGTPVDQDAWDGFKSEIIPNLQILSGSGTVVPTSSTEGILPSHLSTDDSRTVNTLSSLPDASTAVSLVEAINPRNPLPSPSLSKQSLDLRSFEHPPSLRPVGTGQPARMPWAALHEEGLSRDVLLHFDPYFIARSLTLYHRSVLDQTPEEFTADFVMASESPRTENDDRPPVSFAPLFGSDDQPHWLTKLLLLQILGADTSGGGAASVAHQLTSPGRKSEDRGAQTSRTHSRSEVISVWAKVGELCRNAGDECSWRAIAAALCCRPVARLEKAWKRVDPQALAAIESWVYAESESQAPSVKEPRSTPWGSDIKVKLTEELASARGENGDLMVQVAPLRRTRILFDSFRVSFLLCPRKSAVLESEVTDDMRKMVAYWREMAAEGGGTGSMAVKFQRVEQFTSLSLAAEPRRKGFFEPYFWSRSASMHAAHASLIPLLFPEPLPALSLIDRSQLVRGRVDSDTDVQLMRSLEVQLRQNERHNLRLNANQDGTKQAILGQGGTIISVYNGDLLLVVQPGGFESTASSRAPSRAPSRPPSSVVESPGSDKTLSRTPSTISRAPSVRVKPSSSHILDRKTSFARRSSLPSISQRQNFVVTEPSSEPPLRVIVQAGTLNNLVTILVHGLRNVSVSVADDNGEMSLREDMTRELVVDHAEFSKVWWNVFRSFVTPFVFFELLRKQYITIQAVGSSPSCSEYHTVANSRVAVLETMKEWITIGGGAQDILDDLQLYNAVRSFLTSESDHMVFKSENFEDESVRQAWATLTQAKSALHSAFLSQTMRPTIPRVLHNARPNTTANGARTRYVSTRDPPDLDRMDPEEFVDNLDGMACAAFSNVTEEDLYITADLLEVQSTDRTGWFSSRDALYTEESIEIQTIYSHIQEVEPSSMISEVSHEALYRLLPPGIRSCIRAYGIIRKWLISKIVASRLGLRQRQARMELLLQAIEVARSRNSEIVNHLPLTYSIERPCIRSFVEAVTTSAILSVESRMHHRAWQGVGVSRGSQCDTLASLLHRPFVQTITSRDPLTVDMGWLIERMLEVIASPDVVEAMSPEGQSLVNFDKRRHLCNLISKARSLPAPRRTIQTDEVNRRGFERLNNVEKDVLLLQFDHRGIRDEAMQEAMQTSMTSPSSAKKVPRPFHRFVALQNEKNRRDKNLRSRLQKEKVYEQTKNEKRDDLLNKAMRPRKPSTAAQKQHRNKKSMSAFLNFIRPISSAFGSDAFHGPGLKRTASELDFPASGKPALVLSVLDAHVVQFINNERSFTFQLDTEDGGHYLLQAMSKREMTKWLDTITRVTTMAAKRRLTYLGNSPKALVSDHIHSHPVVRSRDPKAVFGVELEFLLQRESDGSQVPPGTVPSIIEECLFEVESRGLSEVGIYRIAGAASEISALKDAYNRGEHPIKATTDIHAVCDLVKSWFRVLSEPVFPSSSYHQVMEVMRLEDLDSRLAGIRSVVQALPQANFDILKRVSEHLDKVTDFEEHNHMTAEALAIVFSPNLLRAPQNDFVMILNNMGLANKLVKALITHFHVIFDDADPEADMPSDDDDNDDELDSPIMEEDEEEDQQGQNTSMRDTSPTPERERPSYTLC